MNHNGSHDTSSSEPVGVIYGDVTTSEFKCAVNAPLERMEYVQVFHETCGPVLCQATSVERHTNLSIDKAQKIANGEQVSIEEKVSATISVIGYRDERNIMQCPQTPVKAGETIHRADEDLIRKVVGLKSDQKVGAYIGLLNGHDIPIYLDINTLVQKHLSVLSKTGGGKSYITGVIIEELMKHNVTTLIIDPHGEYATLAKAAKQSPDMERFGVKPHAYADRILEFSPDTKINTSAQPLKFTLANLEAREILALANVKNVRQALPAVKRAIEALRSTKPSFTMKDLIKTLDADEELPAGNLLMELEYLQEIDIFADRGTKISEMIEKGKTTILNLRGSPADIAELVVNRLAMALFELRKTDHIPPMMMVVEEAHNYCPQQGATACSKIMRTIAAEGRKFGLGLTVITQRPAKVDKNVLSQCNTQVILKITNPNDLNAVTSSVEGLTKGMDEEIQRLPIGVALVTGGSLTMPLLVATRPRETLHGGESVKIIEDN
ncbi:MAG: ATP-binding protein [Euryarchaeota archaeon]|nr:ATP-binding protein [Euryarchaeota archaeon]